MIHSASSVSDAERCLRKWAFPRLDKVPKIPNAKAALGSEVHGMIERYLRFGEPLDLSTKAGQIAMAGAHHWPDPQTPGLEIERAFSITIDGVTFRGFKDLSWPGVVADHKTTSDLRYAIQAEIPPEGPQEGTTYLVTDVQATLYGFEEIRRGSDEVDLRWIYYRTQDAPRSHLVRKVIRLDMIEDRVGRTVETARALDVYAESGARALDLPPSPNACGDYGGCPFYERCKPTLTNSQKLRARMNVQEMLSQAKQNVNPPRETGAAAPKTDKPPTGVDIPEGFVWFRGADGWAITPENLIDEKDPTGELRYPPKPKAPEPEPPPAAETKAEEPAPKAQRGRKPKDTESIARADQVQTATDAILERIAHRATNADGVELLQLAQAVQALR